MKKIIQLLWFALVTTLTLSAAQVNAIYYTKGQKIPTKVDVVLPSNWTVKPSKDSKQWGDYLLTKDRTAYMSLNISEWKNKTENEYRSLMKRNGHNETQVDGNTIISKLVTKGGKRILIGRFLTAEQIEINTQLVPYEQDASLDVEFKEASAILSSAKIIELHDTSMIVDPKIASTKKDLDRKMAKIEAYTRSGEADKFPNQCAVTDESLIKYTFPDAPQEIYDDYKNAQNICHGKLHTIALHQKVKNEGNSVDCKRMELTLQINHLKKYLKKTNDMSLWDDFVADYKKICPNHMNF